MAVSPWLPGSVREACLSVAALLSFCLLQPQADAGARCPAFTLTATESGSLTTRRDHSISNGSFTTLWDLCFGSRESRRIARPLTTSPESRGTVKKWLSGVDAAGGVWARVRHESAPFLADRPLARLSLATPPASQCHTTPQIALQGWCRDLPAHCHYDFASISTSSVMRVEEDAIFPPSWLLDGNLPICPSSRPVQNAGSSCAWTNGAVAYQEDSGERCAPPDHGRQRQATCKRTKGDNVNNTEESGVSVTA